MYNPAINESGKTGEERFENFLIEISMKYKRNVNNGIDFLVYPNGYDNEPIYIDIKNQKDPGGRDLAVGGCVWKYQKRYGFKECYIVEGVYDFSNEVREFANLFAKTHFVKFDEMCNILLNKPTLVERFF